MLENYGSETVGSAAGLVGLKAFASQLKEMINNSNLPDAIKQMAGDFIDGHVASIERDLGLPSDVVEDVGNSEVGEAAAQANTELATDVAEQATDACCVKPEMSDEAAAETATESANESSSTSAPMSDEAATESETEAANEGGSGSTGGVDTSGDDAVAETVVDAGKGQKEKEKASGNFLVALAEAMGSVQGDFLEAALAEQEAMEGMVDKMKENATTNVGLSDDEKADKQQQEGLDAKEFSIAQSKFSANMQMFNMYSTQVSTGLKTIGEALTGIARKQ